MTTRDREQAIEVARAVRRETGKSVFVVSVADNSGARELKVVPADDPWIRSDNFEWERDGIIVEQIS